MNLKKSRKLSVIIVLLAFLAQSLVAAGLPCQMENNAPGAAADTLSTAVHPEHCPDKPDAHETTISEHCCTSDCTCPASCSSLSIVSLQQRSTLPNPVGKPALSYSQVLPEHAIPRFRPPISG